MPGFRAASKRGCAGWAARPHPRAVSHAAGDRPCHRWEGKAAPGGSDRKARLPDQRPGLGHQAATGEGAAAGPQRGPDDAQRACDRISTRPDQHDGTHAVTCNGLDLGAIDDRTRNTMYDTISALIDLDHDLDASAFQGGVTTDDFTTGRQSARLWRNPLPHKYEPRITYWPVGRTLKAEFSVPKLLGGIVNPTFYDVMMALDIVDRFLRTSFGGNLPSVRAWRCQRIDYAWTFDVDPDVYLPILETLTVSRMYRQRYGGSGVVWKNGSRWVKFYDKRKEAGTPGLRFEVSNYNDAVRYMADEWFCCDRDVMSFVHPARAWYVMARLWSSLGLDVTGYRSQSAVLSDLRSIFGRSASSAFYHLHLWKLFGSRAVALGFTSPSSMSRWKHQLEDYGFLVSVDDEAQIIEREIEPLRFPHEMFKREVMKNLNHFHPAPIPHDDQKNLVKIAVPGAAPPPEMEAALCR